MKQLAVIAALAGAIRLATVFDPAAAAVLVGTLAVLAALYGIWMHSSTAGRSWALPWSLVTAGLALCVASTVMQALAGRQPPLSGMVLATTVAGDGLTIIGLAVVLRRRLASRLPETLSAAAVSVLAVAFPILSLAVVPKLGWHPGVELRAIVPPSLDAVLLWLTLDVLSLTERHPPAYRYLAGGLTCMLVSHAVAAGSFLSGRHLMPVPVNSVELWGEFLWACGVLHPSQRQRLDPVPLRSNRPGWPHVLLMVVAVLVTPAVLTARQMKDLSGQSPVLTVASGLLPALVLAYLLYQVYARAAAEYRAQHDPLTGVCNRVLFNDRVDAAVSEARRSGRSLAVMFLDLDRFKSINDSLGHAVGNQLLQAVVGRLEGRLRPADTLARMGGDEFTILFPDVDGPDGVSSLGERILGAFQEPFHVGGKLMPVQTSIGLASYPGDGEDTETLLKNADTAMYRAKAAGRNTFVVYNPAMSARAELRFALETSLRTSLENERMTVHYQPKVSAADGRVVGAEALARWKHPKLGFIPPSAFIPLAEETSLISVIGEYVLESACVQARAWQVSGMPAVPVSVNVSPRQFTRQSMVRMVADILDRTGLDPCLLELEVTESLLVEHMQDTAECLAELRAMGVQCSIDDFGTGYSGLTYLTDMPVDAIKIDPSFVRRIDSKAETAAVVGAVIGLAHSLGLKVVAEGVETLEQYRFLAENECDVLQGYLFSRPLPAGELHALVASGESLLPSPEMSSADLVLSAGLPEDRLEAVLARLSSGADWTEGLEREEVLAILTALESDDVLPVLAARGIRLVPARMAVGTLAGLASVTGSLGAAGVLPSSSGAALASEILQQATGLPVGGDGARGPGVRVMAGAADNHYRLAGDSVGASYPGLRVGWPTDSGSSGGTSEASFVVGPPAGDQPPAEVTPATGPDSVASPAPAASPAPGTGPGSPAPAINGPAADGSKPSADSTPTGAPAPTGAPSSGGTVTSGGTSGGWGGSVPPTSSGGSTGGTTSTGTSESGSSTGTGGTGGAGTGSSGSGTGKNGNAGPGNNNGNQNGVGNGAGIGQGDGGGRTSAPGRNERQLQPPARSLRPDPTSVRRDHR